eukprot:NODE_1315_length_1589_cov_26.014286_g1180_i0.p1 GENE.NODE_1315_length_1589_cov_26.014286_g1180_i0~~NODE_1315_length_1589_cov_26.014286_g1180_i0.p1  ORF type:complete len:356 (+),score=71.45 NODE_1315_length_1589_cov_26.014286_g1180_i0:87-1070(+)
MATFATTFSMFKHGQNIHSKSMLYGPSNDVVLHEEIESTSESDWEELRRRYIQPLTPPNIEGLRPHFRARVSDGEVEGVRVERAPNRKKAGVRRRRRFMNDHFLEEKLQSHMPGSVEEAKAEWYRLFQDQRESPFQKLMSNGAARKAFEPLLDVPMDEEVEILTAINCYDDEAARNSTKIRQLGTEAASRYTAVPRELRMVLQRCVASDELAAFDESFADFASSEDGVPTLELVLPGLPRLICHAVAAYYGLTSYSDEVVEDGVSTRVTYVQRPFGEPVPLPDQSLSAYLEWHFCPENKPKAKIVRRRRGTGRSCKKRAMADAAARV